MGRVPIVTIGLGTSSAYPLMRIPAPPQNRTTFMTTSLIRRISQLPAAEWAQRICRPTREYNCNCFMISSFRFQGRMMT